MSGRKERETGRTERIGDKEGSGREMREEDRAEKQIGIEILIEGKQIVKGQRFPGNQRTGMGKENNEGKSRFKKAMEIRFRDIKKE